jgi:hypothetical protein
MSVWRGREGNREVPPVGLLGGAEANMEEEGGTRERYASWHDASEPKASDAHSGVLRTPAPRGAGWTRPVREGGGSGSGARPAASRDQGGELTPSRTTR